MILYAGSEDPGKNAQQCIVILAFIVCIQQHLCKRATFETDSSGWYGKAAVL